MTRKIRQKINKINAAKIILLGAYILIILDITILSRDPMLVVERSGTVPFWSYALWFHGDAMLGIQIVQNILMFVPLGFLLSWNLQVSQKLQTSQSMQNSKKLQTSQNLKRNNVLTYEGAPVSDKEWHAKKSQGNGKAYIKAMAISFALTVFIEISQFIFKLGTFEFDDIMDNTLGGILGCAAFALIRKIIGKYGNWLDTICKLAGMGVVILGIAICATYIDRSEESGNLESQFAFQVTNISWNNDEAAISGYCFVYEDPARDYELWLKDLDTGKMTKITTKKNLKSKKANEYYKCEYDYSRTGFSGTYSANKKAEYQLYVKWPGMKAIPTGEFINRDISKIFKCDGADLSKLTAKGTLVASKAAADCYVYQYHGKLYWIAGPDFEFNKDNLTIIQCHLDTTQPELLPKERVDKGWDWDDMGFIFEDWEITDNMDCGSYRVAARTLPTEYSITAVTTGVYENGKWRWQRAFRPRVEVDWE